MVVLMSLPHEFKNGLDEADWSTRREIIRALVKRVEIDQEQVRVVFRINPPPLPPQLPSEKDSQSLQHCGERDKGKNTEKMQRTRRQDEWRTRQHEEEKKYLSFGVANDKIQIRV